MEVRPDFKQTEVGVIPADWDLVRVRDLVKQGPKNGYSAPSSDRTSGTPTLSLAATSSGRLILNDETVKYLERPICAGSPLFLEPDDVLVQRSNTAELVGTTAVFDGPPATFVYPDLMMRLRFKEAKTGHWFWRYANSARGRSFFRSAAAGSTGTMPKISGEKLREMLVPMPLPTELEAVAEALNDADTLLDGLDQLLKKKRDIKEAAMQQLLTGQTRLPGFHGDWEVKRLGDIAHIKTGSRNNEDKIEDGKYPFFVRSEMVERINSFSHDCEAILVPGEGRIGSIFHYIRGRFDVHQRVYAITRFKSDISTKFVYFYMSKNFGVWAMQNTVKATVDSLRLPTFKTFEMTIPPTLDEQTAIAAVLTDMDAELAALQQELSKIQEIKQGMIQELLTGKTRLVSLEASHA